MRWPSGRASDSGARGLWFDPYSGRRVVSLSKIHLPKSTGKTQEAVAPSRHDFNWDVKQKRNETKNQKTTNTVHGAPLVKVRLTLELSAKFTAFLAMRISPGRIDRNVSLSI